LKDKAERDRQIVKFNEKVDHRAHLEFQKARELEKEPLMRTQQEKLGQELLEIAESFMTFEER